MAGKNIKLKDGTGAEIDYTGVPKIKIPAADGGSDVIFQLPPTMQEKSVSITSNGTTDVIPDSGYDGLSKVTIATNVAGGSGGETQEKTVQLAMADGDQVITPDVGKTLSSVTVEKPETLVPGNIKKDVVIGGVTGALDPNEGYNNVVDALWGPDQTLATIYGLGEALDTAHFPGIKISAWATVKSGNWDFGVDDSYAYALPQIQLIANEELRAKLNTFAASAMDASGNYAFSKIFEGAEKAAFMDENYITDIPTVESTDARTWNGFVQMLWRSINSTLRNPLTGPGQYFGDISEYPTDGEIMHLPFIWYPVVASGGQTLSGYTLQDPTGEMPTYEEVVKQYEGTGIGVSYANVASDFGIASQVIAAMCVFSGGVGIFWYSYGAQTIPEATMLELAYGAWQTGYGDVTLTTGWNVTEIVDGEAHTENNVSVKTIQTIMSQAYPQGIAPSALPFDQMSEYEKSIFKPLYSQAYKRKNNKSITLDFTLRYYVETSTT